MGLIGIIYALGMTFAADAHPVSQSNLSAGLALIWNPAVIFFLQGIWLVIFVYTGRSTVTGATLNFHVHRDNI
jgi:hypothetical protein